MIKIEIIKPIKASIFVEQKTAKTLEITAPYHPKLLEEFRAMEGYRFDKDKKVTVISDSTRNKIQLYIMKGENPFQIFDEDLRDIKPNRDNLLLHQKLMLNHAISKTDTEFFGGALIAGDMGVGKTLTAIEILEYYKSKGLSNFWYIAPRSALSPFAGIPAEFRKWKAQVIPRFMSYDELKKLVTENVFILPDVLILDEASLIKNATSQRSQAVRGVVEQMREKKNNKIVLLTGTPAPKDPTDWWHLCEVGAPGLLRESDATKLKRRLAVIEYRDGLHGKYPHLVEWKKDEISLLYRRLSGFVLRVRIKDCVKLPPSEKVIHYIKPSEEMMRTAKAITSSTTGTLERLNKLRQLSDGFQYTEDGNYVWGGSPKMDALKEWCELAENRIVIYSGYTASIDEIVKSVLSWGWKVIRIDGRGWQGFNSDGSHNKELSEEYFQLKDENGNLVNEEPVAIVAHPKSGGMSLNFTAAAVQVYYSNDFDGQARMQSGKRIDRLGQTRPTKIVDLVHLPTDELVINNLDNKQELQALSLNDITAALMKGGQDGVASKQI